MMVSTKGKYALRVMLDMAEHGCEDNISLGDIAKRQNLSRKYLESIMTLLAKHGLVKSCTGKVGGYKLCKDPGEYKIGEILYAAEGELVPVSCLSKDESKKCAGECTCYTLPFWRGLEDNINAYINSYTLLDLLNEKRNTPDCRCGSDNGEIKGNEE